MPLQLDDLAAQIENAESVDDGERGAAAARRRRVAVERVLADVEIERRQVDDHEVEDRRDAALEVVGVVGEAHRLAQLGEAVEMLSKAGDANVTLAEQSSQATASLEDEARRLTGSVSRFRLDRAFQ